MNTEDCQMSLRWEGLWISPERRCCRTEVHCQRKKETYIVREYKAMHEGNFLSSWLREDVEGMEERKKINGETRRR